MTRQRRVEANLISATRKIRSGAGVAANDLVVAIVATEMSFRPAWWRLLEYCAYVLLGRPCTIGWCQAHSRFWEEILHARRFKLVPKLFRAEFHYLVASERVKAIGRFDQRNVLICYNGRPSREYVERVTFVVKYCRMLQIRCRTASRVGAGTHHLPSLTPRTRPRRSPRPNPPAQARAGRHGETTTAASPGPDRPARA